MNYKILGILIFVYCLARCSGEAEKTELPESVEETQAISTVSTIKCPHCGFEKEEVLPEEYCLIAYDCDSCQETLHPAKGDCCVFCTFGTHKCPSIQENDL